MKINHNKIKELFLNSLLNSIDYSIDTDEIKEKLKGRLSKAENKYLETLTLNISIGEN